MHNKTDSVRLNITVWCVHITTVVVEKLLSITYFECVCSLSYPECKAHAVFYCHLWPVQFYSIFPCHLIYGVTFRKKLLDI